MNTKTKNHTVKFFTVALTAVLFLFGSPLTSKANGGGSKKNSTITEAQVSVTYQGVADNSLVFKVDYENPTGGKFWLIIKNDNGDVVYHQQFSDAHFSKTIFFQNTDTEINPTFVIHTGSNDIVRQFQVNKIITETTVVKGL
ncbi:MAG TPA: hypothetical protein VFE32_01820 [Puia sp.]|jgi:hypothetical protein|nr:hypothetical protein [Puia sp.]